MSHVFTIFSLLQRVRICPLISRKFSTNFTTVCKVSERTVCPSSLCQFKKNKNVTVRLVNRIMWHVKWKIWDFEKMKPKIEVEYFNKILCFELLKLFSKDSVKRFYGIRIMFKISERYALLSSLRQWIIELDAHDTWSSE